MRRMLWVAAVAMAVSSLAVSSEAFAQEGNETQPGTEQQTRQSNAEAVHEHAAAGEHPGTTAHEKAGEKEDVAGTIFHHVSDSSEYEFDIPLKSEGENPTIHFPRILIPLKANACPANPEVAPSLKAGCLDLSITKHAVLMWLAAVILIVVLLVASNRDRKQLVPKGAGPNIIETLVLFVRDEIAVPNIGKADASRYVPFLLSIFFFILAMNLLGLFPWMASVTGNLAITCGLAVCTFVVTQYAGIRSAGLGNWLKHLTGGVAWWLWPIMIPVEILGLFTKPFALTVRLFANMLAGHVVIFFLLGLIFILGHAAVSVVAVPFAIGIYLLEVFVAFLQAYIFCMLSAIFIGMGVAMGHHHDHDNHDHGDHHVEGSHSHDHGRAHQLG